jgi:uncharacterized repeat protein (TIGR01451 family)
MARRIRYGLLIAVGLLATGLAAGQYIPPTRVPETDEPGLADKKTPQELPDKFKKSMIGAAPAAGTSVTPVTPGRPVSVDPPTPAVSIHVSAPESASAGGDVEYKIVVENKSQAYAHHVRVTFPIPPGVQLQQSEPIAEERSAQQLAWKLETLKPGDKKEIRVVVLANKDGMEWVDGTARVQFEHGQKVRTVLHRPQLAIRKVTNRHELVNDPISCKLIVENTGAVDVTGIKLDELLNEGLTFAAPGTAVSIQKHWDIEKLGPKQTREFTYSVFGTKQGTLTSKIEARAERGVKVEQSWQINVGPSPLSVKLNGPKQVYLNYPARYDIEVDYKGTAPLDNVVVVFGLQKGMKIVRSTPGAKSFEDRLQWAVPKLTGGGKPTTFSVWAQANVAGNVPIWADALWHGPKQHAEATTEFVGAAALHLDLRESADPVRVGEKVRYTLTVTNRGTAAATDVRLLASFPMTQFAVDKDGTDGEMTAGTQVIGPLTIPPKGSVTKTITLKATAAGKAVLHVEMESKEHLQAGNVTREEPTTITE